MPLSRHFYSLDEVQAALFYTGTRNIPEETIFWCQEMILSGYIGETISTLFQSWLWNTGPMRLQWLINAWKNLASDELTEDTILEAAYQLSTISHTQRDSSLWNILVLTIQNPELIPDRVTRKTPKNMSDFMDEKELYFIRAIYQGKSRSAWWISQYIKDERIWQILLWFAENNTRYKEEYKICLEALQGYDKLLGYKTTEYDIITRCLAIISMSIWPEKQNSSFKPFSEMNLELKEYINDLTETIGYSKHRLYEIPKICLYGTTLRGRSKWTQKNLIQLYNVEKYILGCPFWDEVIEEYGTIDEKNEIQWNSVDKMEEFYEKYFPDDIPDEWTKKEQLKSHGDGILAPDAKPNISKYSRTFMNKLPLLAWNTSREVNKYLEQVEISDCAVERIVESFKSLGDLSEENLKKLRPVHKIKIKY
jgi:hypothetical protein